MLDAVAVAQNNKRLGPGSSASGLLTDPKPIPKTNSQTLNLDVPAITNLNLIPSVPVLPRPPYRFHPGVYTIEVLFKFLQLQMALQKIPEGLSFLRKIA